MVVLRAVAACGTSLDVCGFRRFAYKIEKAPILMEARLTALKKRYAARLFYQPHGIVNIIRTIKL